MTERIQIYSTAYNAFLEVYTGLKKCFQCIWEETVVGGGGEGGEGGGGGRGKM